MISTVMCSRESLQNVQCNSHIRSPVRIEPRRNTIPPTQALTAKHLLAYLPRPQPESVRYTPYTYKVRLSILYDVLFKVHLHSDMCFSYWFFIGCLSFAVEFTTCMYKML